MRWPLISITSNCAVALLFVSLAAARPLPRDPPAEQHVAGQTPRHRLHYFSLTGVQYNPIGIQTDLLLNYRYRLWRPTSALFQDTYVGGGPLVRINPAYARAGVGIELQPLAVICVRAQYEFRGYFATAGMMQSFTGAGSEHHDDLRARRADLEMNYGTTGHQLNIQAILRAKVGNWAVLNDFIMTYFHMNLQGTDTVFYDAFMDILAPGQGVVVANHAHLFYVTGEGLTVGLRHTVAHAFYSDEALGPGASTQGVVTPTHRLGPMLVYEFSGRGPRFQKPTLAVILNWWLEHRYRAGQQVNRGIPYVAVGFFFSGDLWSSN